MPPGRGAGTAVAAPGVPLRQDTYLEEKQRRRRVCGGSGGGGGGGGRRLRQAGGRADERAGWPGSGGAGAACAEPRTPAPTAAVAAVLRLQWSAAPQPLLSHGRGALAGRRSRLPAPGSR